MQPRTPRAPSDRGRYPEEVSEERDIQGCQTPSDDSDYEETDSSIPFAFAPPSQEPITIRTRTPAASVSGSLCGDDISAESPGAAMDIDMVSSSKASLFECGANANLAAAPICVWFARRSLAPSMEIYSPSDVIFFCRAHK